MISLILFQNMIKSFWDDLIQCCWWNFPQVLDEWPQSERLPTLTRLRRSRECHIGLLGRSDAIFFLLNILVIFDNFAAILPAKLGELSFHWMLTVKWSFEDTSYNLLPSDWKTTLRPVVLVSTSTFKEPIGRKWEKVDRGSVSSEVCSDGKERPRPQLTDPTGKRCSKENGLRSFDWQSFLLQLLSDSDWFPATAIRDSASKVMNGLTLTPMWGLFLI